MSCKCSKAPKLVRQTPLPNRNNPRQVEVTQEILTARRDACRICPFSTKRTKKNLRTKIDVLGPLSSCKKANRPLNKALKDPKFSCPIENFSAAEPKVRN